MTRWRTGALLAPLLAVGAAGVAPCATPTGCAEDGPRASGASEFVREAVEVLRACGKNPRAFRVELRVDDPFTRVGSGRGPEMTAIFWPQDAERDYPVGVSAADPCVVTWIEGHERGTRRQREILAAIAEQIASKPERGPDTDPPTLRITESARWIGAAVWFGEPGAGRQPDLRIVLSQADLVPVEPGR